MLYIRTPKEETVYKYIRTPKEETVHKNNLYFRKRGKIVFKE